MDNLFLHGCLSSVNKKKTLISLQASTPSNNKFNTNDQNNIDISNKNTYPNRYTYSSSQSSYWPKGWSDKEPEQFDDPIKTQPLLVKIAPRSFKEKAGLFFWQVLFLSLTLGSLSFYFFSKVAKLPNMDNNIFEPVIDNSDVTFNDIIGCDEAKEELKHIVNYLKDPIHFNRLGGKLPKGILLTGSPGTGKTLLAKAVANEADVPFFYSSGSSFEEVYVGVGARRLRDLFSAARDFAPCIIFIDELDSLGGIRSQKNLVSSNMTLNQLLVEIDGFKDSEGVIIIGATNFPEILDPALLRSGRFDQKVHIPLPDISARRKILDHYLKKIVAYDDVNIDEIARSTPGVSGADLANIVNSAALVASSNGANCVTHTDLENALEKIQYGPALKSHQLPEKIKEITAYHEGGHAIVALLTEFSMPVLKATIVPRGSSLGAVHHIPEETDSMLRSKSQMLADIDVCMGGRAAEEIKFGSNFVSSGASSDFQKASQIARNMIEAYCMNTSNVSSVMHGLKQNNNSDSVSEATREYVDGEVSKILQDSYERVHKLLLKHQKELHRLAEALLLYETLSKEQIEFILKGKELPLKTNK